MLRTSILGCPGGSGRASGGVRGGSGRRLGGTWGSPGGSWEGLGGVLVGLGAILKRLCEQSDFRSIFGSIWGGFGGGLGKHFGDKMPSKTHQNLTRFFTSKKSLSKSVLEPSWVDLRSFWVASWGQIMHWHLGKRSVCGNFTFSTKKTSQEASWSDLGWIWTSKTTILGAKNPPRGRPRRAKNETKMTSIFGSIFGSIFDRFWRPRKLRRSSGGGTGGLRGACLRLQRSRKSSISIQTRSDPSGGGGFNRFAHSAGPSC